MGSEVGEVQGVWLRLYAKRPSGNGEVTVGINGTELSARPLGHNAAERGLQPYWVKLPPDVNIRQPLKMTCSVEFTLPVLYVRLSKESLEAM